MITYIKIVTMYFKESFLLLLLELFHLKEVSQKYPVTRPTRTLGTASIACGSSTLWKRDSVEKKNNLTLVVLRWCAGCNID